MPVVMCNTLHPDLYFTRNIDGRIDCIYRRGLLALPSNFDRQCEKPKAVGR